MTTTLHYEKIICSIADFIREEVHNRNSEGVVLGVSGGIDSSLTATLAVKAIGSKKVLGLSLPDSEVTPERDTRQARQLALALGIEYETIEIGDIKKQMLKQLPRKNKLAEGNLLARLRMCILYYYAGVKNRLVLGTGTKSEIKIGYFTKYGDGAADILPIADLYKTDVRLIGAYLSLPSGVLEQESSPRLWKDQIAEAEIGLSYEEIDNVLKYLDKDPNAKIPNKRHMAVVLNLMKKTEHKRNLPPTYKL